MRNLGSRAEKGSSNNKMGLSRSKQRANATRCFCMGAAWRGPKPKDMEK